MVIFRDKSSMWAAWKELFKRVGRLRILAHVIPKSLDEFFKTEPTLFEEIRSHGKVLFLRYPLSMPMLLGLKRAVLLTYKLEGLDQRNKAKLMYRLYGKGGKAGLVERLGGTRVAEGCLLVSEEEAPSVRRVLAEGRARVEEISLYYENQLRTNLGRKPYKTELPERNQMNPL